VLLEEADFIVQQMLFLGEEVFLNSTIYKALVRFKNYKRINQRRNLTLIFTDGTSRWRQKAAKP
jgi:hypothetical protein